MIRHTVTRKLSVSVRFRAPLQQDRLVPVKHLCLRTSIKITKTEKRFKKIILVKSVTILEGEDVGFERRFKEKMFPFTISF
jgi:hypothetical protein